MEALMNTPFWLLVKATKPGSKLFVYYQLPGLSSGQSLQKQHWSIQGRASCFLFLPRCGIYPKGWSP